MPFGTGWTLRAFQEIQKPGQLLDWGWWGEEVCRRSLRTAAMSECAAECLIVTGSLLVQQTGEVTTSLGAQGPLHLSAITTVKTFKKSLLFCFTFAFQIWHKKKITKGRETTLNYSTCNSENLGSLILAQLSWNSVNPTVSRVVTFARQVDVSDMASHMETSEELATFYFLPWVVATQILTL